MSQVKIQGNASGTGIFTVASPNSNTDRTLTLPDVAGILAVQGGAGVGKVLQVVQATSTSGVNTTSTSFVTTNFSASITPSSSSSKVLVILSGGDLDCQAGGRQIYATIYRNGSTNLGSSTGLCSVYHDTARSIAPANGSVLDSPATTSSTTYTVYFRSSSNRVDFNGQNGQVSLTLMEIAA